MLVYILTLKAGSLSFVVESAPGTVHSPSGSIGPRQDQSVEMNKTGSAKFVKIHTHVYIA
jgi:hypothetical protein